MRLDTIKLLEENIGRTLSNINRSNIFFFFSPSPRIMEIKTRINKQGLLKRFCTAKEPINKTKRQPTLGENICKWCDWMSHSIIISLTSWDAYTKFISKNSSYYTWHGQMDGWMDTIYIFLSTHAGLHYVYYFQNTDLFI